MMKLSILTTLSTMIKFITAFLINKIIATYIGPSGLAIIGQLQSFIAIAVSLSNFGINQGVTKYIAEDKSNKNLIISNAFKIVTFSTIIISICIIVFYSVITNYIFKNNSYDSVIILLSLTMIFFSINTLLVSITNGQQKYKKLILISIFTNIISLVLMYTLIYFYSLIGALYSLVTVQVITLFFTVYLVKNNISYKIIDISRKLDIAILKKLLSYSIIAFVTVISSNLALILARELITSNYSVNYAGYWQGMWYISSMYLLFISIPLNMYYFPKMSSTLNKLETKKIFKEVSLIAIPTAIFLGTVVYLLKDFIIEFVFTREFLAMKELFFWSIIGDIFKISSWLLSYIMIARAMIKEFVITELILNINFILLSYIFLEFYGFIGMSYAYALNYLLYCIILYYVVYKKVLA